MAEVIWTRRALRDLFAIQECLFELNPLAANRLAFRLLDARESLKDNPRRGRPISSRQRELTIVSPYLILYNVAGGIVQIREIRHGSRRPR